jgi:RNA polymerase primary sigma factor
MVHQTEMQQDPLLICLSSLNLKPKATEILTQAKKVGVLSTGELLSVIPAATLKDEVKLNATVEWVMQLCDALEIVILPTSSKSRMERAVVSGERIASYQAPIKEAEIRKTFEQEEASSEKEAKKSDEEEPSVDELDTSPSESYLEQITRDVHQDVLAQKDDSLAFFFRIAGSYKLLKPHQTAALATLVQEKNDVDARNEIVVHNLRASVMVARRYRGRGLDFLDLIQEANLGLMRGAEKFDPTRGFQFMTYAMWWIRQAVVRAIYDYAELVRVPVNQRELWNKVMKTSAKLVESLGREPRPEEIAKALGKSVEEVERALRQMKMTTVYLDDIAQRENGKGEELGSVDWLPELAQLSPLSPEQLLSAKEDLAKLCKTVESRVLARLSSYSVRDQNIFRGHYGLDGTEDSKTLEHIGIPYSLTRGRTQQIIAKIWSDIAGKEPETDEIWLEGELYRIQQLAETIDPDDAAEILSVISPVEPTKSASKPSRKATSEQIRPSDIIGLVCSALRVSNHLVLGTSSKGKVSHARGVAVLLLHDDLKRTFWQIATDVNQDTEKVHQIYDQIREQLKQNEWLSELVKEVRKIYR